MQWLSVELQVFVPQAKVGQRQEALHWLQGKDKTPIFSRVVKPGKCQLRMGLDNKMGRKRQLNLQQYWLKNLPKHSEIFCLIVPSKPQFCFVFCKIKILSLRNVRYIEIETSSVHKQC